MALYGSVPLLISHSLDNTAAIFWFNSAETWVDISDSQIGVDTHWFSAAGTIDLWLIPGPTIGSLYKQYTSIVGVTPLPNLFSIG